MSEGISDENDVGYLVALAIRAAIDAPWRTEMAWTIARKYWASVIPYYQRQIICDLEVATARDDFDKYPVEKALWVAFVVELTPPRSEFSIVYRCDACGAEGLKLWRGVHGCKDEHGHALKCAACLAPGIIVDEAGREPYEYGGTTDQVGGWLPACPTGDTFWGYSSVPSVDVKWWKALPTYAAPGARRRA